MCCGVNNNNKKIFHAILRLISKLFTHGKIIFNSALRRWRLLASAEQFLILTLFFPMFPFDPSENIKKPKVFWCFQRDQKGTLGRKRLNKKVWNICLILNKQLFFWDFCFLAFLSLQTFLLPLVPTLYRWRLIYSQ